MTEPLDKNDILQASQYSPSGNYAAQVHGDSMEPEFPDQCEVIIHPTDNAYNGAYILVDVEGVRWFRQYLVDKEGARLVAVNNIIYPEIVLEKMNWKILGVVVQRNINYKVKHYKPAAVNGLKVPLYLSPPK